MPEHRPVHRTYQIHRGSAVVNQADHLRDARALAKAYLRRAHPDLKDVIIKSDGYFVERVSR